MNVSAIIMAAGLSKRMNQNKLQMKINNKYIFEYIFDTIKKCDTSFNEIIVVAKDDDIINKAVMLGFKTVKNEVSYMGQSISIKLGMQNSNATDGYMFFVADQPFITENTIKELLRAFETNRNKIIMACYNGINGSPTIFPELFKNELLKLEGDTGGKLIIKNNEDELVKVHIQSENEFIDIDTIEDYERIVKEGDILNGEVVVVKSGGDIASGVIQKLHRTGFRVLVLEIEKPTSIRRTVCFSEAVYNGKMELEGITSVLVKNIVEIYHAWANDYVPVIIDPKGQYIENFKPIAVVDAIIAKKNTGMHRDLAPITVAIGPGFEAGNEVSVVIESNRGHNLGKLIYEGSAEPNTGKPGNILGFTTERVLYSPDDGIISLEYQIGDTVKIGDVIGYVNGQTINSKIDGMVRGLIRDGTYVTKGFKVGDVDPRACELLNCYTISDKARAIGGAVLEAIIIEIEKIKNL